MKVDSISSSSVTLSWDEVENAMWYEIYSADTLVGGVTGTSLTITDLTAGTEYSFIVAAVRNEQVMKSEAIVVKTLEAEPEPEQPEQPGEGVEELEASFSIYPNPVNDKLYIETLTQTQTLTIEIYDVYGRRQELSVINCQPSAIDVSNLNSGVYFVKVITDEGEVVKRIVKN